MVLLHDGPAAGFLNLALSVYDSMIAKFAI